MKKRVKIALCILGALVLALAVTAVRQQNNLKALFYGLRMSSDSLEQQMQDSRKVMDDAMEEFHIEPHSFTDDEIAALADGTLSLEGAAELLIKEPEQPESAPDASPEAQTDVPAADNPADTSAPQPPAVQNAAPSADDQIQQCIAQMYVLQATYEGKLDALVQSVMDEYSSGELTQERKQQIIAGRVSEALALESECDAQVDGILTKLRSLLADAGKDDALAVQIEQTYQEQKSLKKAQYLKQYRGE